MRKETKIGLFALITIALAIWGYNYLKGFNLLSPKTTVFVEYQRVDGLRISTPVLLNGLQVGLVADIRQDKNDLSKIRVTLELDREVRIPKTATANIISTSLMGGTAVELEFKGTCSGNDCLQNGDTIQGTTKSLLASMADPEEVNQYVQRLNQGLQQVLDTLSQRLKQSEEIQQSVNDVRGILENLHRTSSRLDALMNGSVNRSMQNIEVITTTLRNSNEQIKTILDNAAALSTDLQNAEIDQLAAETRQTVSQLRQMLSTGEKALADLEKTLSGINGGQGAVAMLLHDPAFAKELQLTVEHLQLLLQDIRLHPERYRRILSKKQMPYNAPAQDPGLKN
ncbi:MAG: organic solvent ABC transporter substrate-binding protein [Saprospiraceae bacterium]|nr:MAG: organic solvent ABC transporter substrate-binding protein [Saprospiraceae bacterium]